MQTKLFVCGMTGGFYAHDATSQVEPLSSHDQFSFTATANGEGLFIGIVRGEGHIYVWGHRFRVLESLFPGSERRVPVPLRVRIPPSTIIPNPPQRFVHVSVGHGSFVAVATTGELYTTHLAPAQALPLLRKPLPFLAAEACIGGGDKEFCLIRGVNGELAGFGANDHGQLTRPGSADHGQLVMALTDWPTAGIAAGINHTLVLDATGHAWSCGDNQRGQLGRDSHHFNRNYHLLRVLLLLTRALRLNPAATWTTSCPSILLVVWHETRARRAAFIENATRSKARRRRSHRAGKRHLANMESRLNVDRCELFLLRNLAAGHGNHVAFADRHGHDAIIGEGTNACWAAEIHRGAEAVAQPPLVTLTKSVQGSGPSERR